MHEGVGNHLGRLFAEMSAGEPEDAFAALLLGFAAGGHAIEPKAREDGKSDTHFRDDSGVRTHAVNKSDLLFYFRKHAPKPDMSTLRLIVTHKPEVGEVTVRVANLAEARQVLALIGLPHT